MQKIRSLISFLIVNRKVLFHIPRSLYYNIRLVGVSAALRCPIFIHNNVKVNLGKGGAISIKTNLRSGLVKIGFNTTNFYNTSFDKSILTILGEWVINGPVNIGPKSRISIGENAKLETSTLWITGDILLIVRKHICIGDNAVFSWNITMMDHDAHGIFDDQGNRTNIEKDIIIGNNVWIGCNSTILKGVEISHDIVIGANSVEAKKIEASNVVLAGNPVEIKKKNITWGGFY